MSQRIYLDDCAYAKQLVTLLQMAGHQVVVPAEVGLTGKPDISHFRYACSQDLVLLTKNPSDFAELHKADPSHAGILAVYQDNDPGRDMSYAKIVKAIANLEAAGENFKDRFHVLNVWRF